MDLGSVFARVAGKSGSAEKSEQYLAVKISSSEVLATVWAISDGQVDIGHVGTEKIDGRGFEPLLHAADTAVSLSLDDQNLSATKTIFGISPDWVEDGKIVEEKLNLLRRLCKELDLRPLGYVQLFEAIENYLKEVEGAPLTAILIGLDGEAGWVTLYRAGKDLGTVVLPTGDGGEDGIAKRIEEALRHFTELEILPARIIIYDGRKDLKKLEEKIMAHPWTKQLQFLHFPRVESLSGDVLVKAVAIAGGTQMGGRIEPMEMPVPEKAGLPKTAGKQVEKEDIEEDQDNDESVEESITEKMSEEEGEEKSLAQESETMPEATENMEPELEEISAEEAGFIQEGDLGRLHEMEREREENQSLVTPKELPKFNLSEKLVGVTPKVTSMFDRLKNIVPKGKLPAVSLAGFSGKRPPPVFLLAGLGLAMVLLVLGAVAYLVPQARVLVYLNGKSFDRQMDATISGQFVQVSEIGSKKGVATGRKIVGEKARGTVTIYGASSSKTFSAGTTLTSTDGLKFTLDQDAAVASASDFLSPATVTAKATAADIGDKYNIPAGTRFTVDNQSTTLYLAKNDSAFSGGNSHEATVVTKLDQDRLAGTLSAELATKAQTDLLTKLSEGQSLLPNAVTSEVTKQKFSKDVDMEADTISLDLSLNYKGITVSQDELVARFLDKYSGDVPSGYQMLRESERLDIKSAKMDKNGNAVLTVALSGKLVPALSSADLVKNISGKDTKQATNYILANTGVDRVEIEANPRIFQSLISKIIPWKASNIKLELVNQ